MVLGLHSCEVAIDGVGGLGVIGAEPVLLVLVDDDFVGDGFAFGLLLLAENLAFLDGVALEQQDAGAALGGVGIDGAIKHGDAFV